MSVWRCPSVCWVGDSLNELNDGCPTCGTGVVAVDAEAAAAELRTLGNVGMTATRLRRLEGEEDE